MDQTIQNVLRDTRFYELLLGFATNRRVGTRGSMPEVRRGAALGIVRAQPRGVPVGLGPEHLQRFSLGCAADGCRKRETPSSLRFLGRKVFLGAMVVLISAMQSGLTPARLRQLQELVGVSRRTFARWRDWWRSVFTESPFWRAHGAFVPPVTTADRSSSTARVSRTFAVAAVLVSAIMWCAGPSPRRGPRG